MKFIIKYKVADKDYSIIKEGTYKANFKLPGYSEEIASFRVQMEFGGFMQKKYPGCDVIIESCEKENPFNGMFGDFKWPWQQ